MMPVRMMVTILFYGKQQPTQSPHCEAGTEGFYLCHPVSFWVTMYPGPPLGLRLPGKVTVVFTTQQVRIAGLEVLSRAAKTVTVSWVKTGVTVSDAKNQIHVHSALFFQPAQK